MHIYATPNSPSVHFLVWGLLFFTDGWWWWAGERRVYPPESPSTLSYLTFSYVGTFQIVLTSRRARLRLGLQLYPSVLVYRRFLYWAADFIRITIVECWKTRTLLYSYSFVYFHPLPTPIAMVSFDLTVNQRLYGNHGMMLHYRELLSTTTTTYPAAYRRVRA